MESDSCQEGSGLPCPLLGKNQGRGERCISTGCLCLPLRGLNLIQERVAGRANHRKPITKQSCHIISMRAEYERKWREVFLFLLCLVMYEDRLSIYLYRDIFCLSLCFFFFPIFLFFSLKASCLESPLSSL